MKIIINFIHLFIIGLWYYSYNFLISISDFLLILRYFTKYIKLLIVKVLIFYEYIFLPPRWVIPLEIKKYKIPKPENYTYGETPYITIFNIIKDLSERMDIKNYTFIDLGCGTGKTIFTVSIMFNMDSIGVENIQTFINKSNKIKKILNSVTNINISFIKMDIQEFLDKELEKLNTDKIIFFIASTAFEKQFFEEIIEKIFKKTNQSFMITISKEIPKKLKESLETQEKTIFKIFSKKYHYSWGKSSTHFYKIISKN
ncbi:MAG: methyltransferase domain-containing protein [Candidatus Calescibacterium sp.]|nr:class I SAM-dependent methyltransferase [Candidatus Calescibacterium sp.]MDW8133265.1 methyltransferase domain-containing protein [Candidatus Calescibacterium sp.]